MLTKQERISTVNSRLQMIKIICGVGEDRIATNEE
ncbi:hypothetical protein T4C_11074 [Trichinella pseudospiralis]|uniref:Uncharacterized protein n=1 Tax=Trichinella pseudospiralis TaxID=6337 RepID=A0A0V1GB05_TRIPS|nr:hypothetical protein T4C_11074 [Trichinella pseudospiralis]